MRRSLAGSQSRNDHEFSQLEGGKHNLLAGAGQVMLVGVADLADQAMRVQAHGQAGDLGVDGRVHQRVVERAQVVLPEEHEVGTAFLVSAMPS